MLQKVRSLDVVAPGDKTKFIKCSDSPKLLKAKMYDSEVIKMDLYKLKEPYMDDLASMKGFRKDYFVKVSNAFYQMYFYTWNRF